jgi:hypothetical protein
VTQPTFQKNAASWLILMKRVFVSQSRTRTERLLDTLNGQNNGRALSQTDSLKLADSNSPNTTMNHPTEQPPELTAESLESSRSAFEDWTGHSKPPERIDEDRYLSKPLQSDWRLWQAAVEWATEHSASQLHSLRSELATAKERIGELEKRQWQDISTAPKDGTKVLLAAIDDGVVFDVVNGYFEVLDDDEEDGPWDIRNGEPWCSYEGREAGIYFCYWLPDKELETRTLFSPAFGYTHWMPLPEPPTSHSTKAEGESRECS